MRRFREQFRSAVTLPPTLFLADYIINIAGFEFSTGTGRSCGGFSPCTKPQLRPHCGPKRKTISRFKAAAER